VSLSKGARRKRGRNEPKLEPAYAFWAACAFFFWVTKPAIRLRTPFDSTVVSAVTLSLFVSKSVLNESGVPLQQDVPELLDVLGF